MNLNLTGKSAIVTGASRGIGRAIALELAAEGCDVVLVARTRSLLDAVAADVRSKGRLALAVDADLRDPSAASRIVDAAVKELGRIDLLVSCAGATKRGDFLSLTDDDFIDGFALKFHGAVRMARAAWPHLVTSRGSVLHIIGAGGKTASGDFTIGGPVNAALLNFTKALAQVGAKDGVRVNGINPGFIETERLRARLEATATSRGISIDDARAAQLDKAGVPRFGQPSEIGQLVCFLASERASYMQGALVDMDGGFTRSL